MWKASGSQYVGAEATKIETHNFWRPFLLAETAKPNIECRRQKHGATRRPGTMGRRVILT